MTSPLPRIAALAGLLLGFLFALACGGTKKAECNSDTCKDGCCDSAGTCQVGTASPACGKGGGACIACLPSQSCTNRICTAGGAGGGGGVGGGAGGGVGGGAGGGAGGGGGQSFGLPASGDAGVAAYMSFCAEAADAFCAYRVRCGFAVDFQTCRASATINSYTLPFCFDEFTTGPILAAIRDGHSQFDPTAAHACTVAATGTLPCDRAGPFNASECVDTLFVPQQPAGSPCYIENAEARSPECVNDGWCDQGAVSTCPGQCSARVPVDGGTFANDLGQCVRGAYAYDFTGTGGYQCVTPAASGSSCAVLGQGIDRQRCATGTTCDVSNLCSPLGGAAANCSIDDECQPQLYCVNGSCGALPGADAGCNTTSGFGTDCLEGLECDFSASANGTCSPLATANGDCSSLDCAPDLFCDTTSSLCQPKVGLDAGCTYNECSPGFFCNTGSAATGTCAALRVEGESCTGSQDCVLGLDCGASSTCVPSHGCP